MARIVLSLPVRRTSDSVLIANTSPRLEVFRTATYATAAGSSSVSLAVAERGGLSTGDSIYIGTNAAVAINSVTSTGPGTVTLASALSWSNNDAVVVKAKTGASVDAYATIYDDPDFATAITQTAQAYVADAQNVWTFFAKPGRYGVRYSNSTNATLRLDAEVTWDELAFVQVSPQHDSPTAGIAEAIAKLPTNGGTVYLGAGTFQITGGVTVTKNNVVLRGDGPDATRIESSIAAGDAIKIDLTSSGNGGVFSLEGVGIRQITNALTADAILVNCLFANRFTMKDVTVTQDSAANLMASGVALSLKDVNTAWLHDFYFRGHDTGRIGVGIDLCNGVSSNRGNVSMFGGILERCTTGVRIAKNATNLVNNIQLFGTKLVLSGTAAQTDGIGIDAYTQAEGIMLWGAHVEAYGTSVKLSGCRYFTADTALFSAFNLGATPIAISLDTACEYVRIANCAFTNNAVGGTAILLDASAHHSIQIGPNRTVNTSAYITDNGTGSNNSKFYWGSSLTQKFHFQDRVTITNGPFIRTPAATQNITAAATAIIASDEVRLTADANYTLSAAPTIADGVDGQHCIIMNVDTTDTITLQDQGTLPASNLRLSAATIALGPRDSIVLEYSSAVGDWVQIAQTNVV